MTTLAAILAHDEFNPYSHGGSFCGGNSSVPIGYRGSRRHHHGGSRALGVFKVWPDDARARIATAFNRHYADERNARNLMQRRQEILNDITDTGVACSSA